MTTKKTTDRHSPDSVQFKAWVPRDLRTRFNACCSAQGTPAAVALRSLLEAYCTQVEGFGQSGPEEGSHGSR
jgi:hypothetical protein